MTSYGITEVSGNACANSELAARLVQNRVSVERAGGLGGGCGPHWTMRRNYVYGQSRASLRPAVPDALTRA